MMIKFFHSFDTAYMGVVIADGSLQCNATFPTRIYLALHRTRWPCNIILFHWKVASLTFCDVCTTRYKCSSWSCISAMDLLTTP